MDLLEREWFIEAPWGKICVVAWGNCFDPPVLMCHGGLDTAATFRPLMKLMPPKFYYVAFELPGCGKSTSFPPGLILSLYDYAYAMHVVVRHFRWEEFVVIAHSVGCAVANIYNLSYPGKITKFIQFDPVYGRIIKPSEFHAWYQSTFEEYFKNYKAYNEHEKKTTREEALQNLMKRRGITLQCAEATLERMTVPAENGLISYTHDRRGKIILNPPFSADYYKEILMKLDTKVLAIISDESKQNGRFSSTSFVLNEMQQSKDYRVVVVNGNHDVHFVNPERVVSYVTEFLLNVDNKAKL